MKHWKQKRKHKSPEAHLGEYVQQLECELELSSVKHRGQWMARIEQQQAAPSRNRQKRKVQLDEDAPLVITDPEEYRHWAEPELAEPLEVPPEESTKCLLDKKGSPATLQEPGKEEEEEEETGHSLVFSTKVLLLAKLSHRIGY